MHFRHLNRGSGKLLCFQILTIAQAFMRETRHASWRQIKANASRYRYASLRSTALVI